ncbi:MAG: glucokinase [Deltaproteobacteria bacterium]|nr:glucokinase [Deltaproteobacteria bacterium]
MLIAGDVGGTKTNLGIYELTGEANRPVVEATLPSAQYDSLESLVSEFLKSTGFKPEYAVFGVAGPIMGSRATITNLHWIIEEDQIKKELGLKTVRLLNDLQAIAYGIAELEEEDLFTLNQGSNTTYGPIAVIAPGTGLGEAYITRSTSSRHVAHASEGGHADFGPTDALEIRLLSYMLEHYEHVSYERICSGIGIPNIYSFLREKESYEEPAWFSSRLSSAADKTAMIISAALDTTTPCELCSKTLNLFLSILGSEAGNLALKVMATGGVYLGGGIPPKVISAFPGSPFMKSFTKKGRLSHVLEQIPVHVILNPKAALTGAALFGLEYLCSPE